jgi:hypothetical protein
MATTTYTALDWQYQPHKVEITGRVLVSLPSYNLHLVECSGYSSVYYGLQVKHFSFLSDAAKEYEQCERHARARNMRRDAPGGGWGDIQ